MYDLAYQILSCRYHYLRCPGKIPNSLEGQARYWKQFYNTRKGKGTIQEYIKNYNKYCR